MATTSVARIIAEKENICQGDVFKNVQYNYINGEDKDNVEIIEYTFPYAIIISQGCDVLSMGEMVENHEGKMTKFMPSILMCPIYHADYASKAKHMDDVFPKFGLKVEEKDDKVLYTRKDKEVMQKDWHYRYHMLRVVIGRDIVMDKACLDFKHYFTVPASYLVRNRKNRIFRLDDIYAEQITLKFSTFLARVAMPVVDIP